MDLTSCPKHSLVEGGGAWGRSKGESLVPPPPSPAFPLGSRYSLTGLRRRGFIPKSREDLSQWLSTLFRVITTLGALKTSARWSTAQPDLAWKLVRETDSQVAPQHQVRISGPEQSQSGVADPAFSGRLPLQTHLSFFPPGGNALTQ